MARIDTLGNFLTDVADAIRTKAGTSEPIQASSFDTAIANIPSGGGSLPNPDADVIFFDYDGTITNSYTKAEFLALEAMPDNPSHAGLTAQGWTYTLQEAKTLVTNYDTLEIGQCYTTTDGSTKIHISLYEGRLTPYLGFGINGTATVDWGDNSATSTVTGADVDTVIHTSHAYANPGNYVISISSETNIKIKSIGSNKSSLLLASDSNSDVRNVAYLSAIKEINCSNNTILDSAAFGDCGSLEKISIPTTITTLSARCFSGCLNLYSAASLATTVGEYAFNLCRNLHQLSLPLVTSLGASVINTTWLHRLTLPSLASISSNTAIYNNRFEKLVLPNLSSISVNAKNTMASNGSLKEILIPNITSIPPNTFYSNEAITYYRFSKKITSVGAEAFSSNKSVAFYDFSSTNQTSVPALSNVSAFAAMASDCKIIVPDSLYTNWKAANNWSNASIVDHIIKKSDWDAL